MAVAAAEQYPRVEYADWENGLERRKSFDVLASVRMYRYDLERFGRVLPETRERVRDEELSLLAEGMDRAACTEFVYEREGDDLVYDRNGQRLSCMTVLLDGLEVAKQEAAKNPQRQFLADEAVDHLRHMYQIRKLRPGEQHVYTSSYRKDLELRYGKAFMRACGRVPEREMGFMYRAYCTDTGAVVLESQTLDRSNDQAFAALLARAAQNPNASRDELVEAYDMALAEQLGGRFFAGRRGAEINENAWNVMLAQEDLIGYFLTRLETIARGRLEGLELEEAVKRHMYGVWAAFKKRLDGETIPSAVRAWTNGGVPTTYYAMLDREVDMAFRQFVAEGRVMIGCGGEVVVLNGENDVLNADPADVFAAIFGKGRTKSGEDDDCEFISKECPNCKKKNVRTVVRKRNGYKRISGDCGCSVTAK